MVENWALSFAMPVDNILISLNSSQRAAVSSAAQTLAILAGPGSGKTHTLTSRTAWLLKNSGFQPWNIIIATFTVKAAREMKERIGNIIGDGMEKKLILGTFHSISRRYLSRYGHLISIERDFGIADSSDSLAIIRRIVKRHKLTIDPVVARSRISGRKAKGSNYQPAAKAKHSAPRSLDVQELEICFEEYENSLKRSNLLDYDDLLLRCVDLLRAHPSCVSNVEAVLIDEFQDTNLVQFDLMRLFAAARNCVTIVGDPDQSIYGFRSAETENFKRMLAQYPETITIPLEENYRSSGAILLTALEVIQQDESRIAKSLTPTHIIGIKPVLRKLSSAQVEAQWIVLEIKRCLGLTASLITYDDVAILLRSASLSRHIESALGKAGIAYRMVGELWFVSELFWTSKFLLLFLICLGGLRFYDRVEVKIILDYLRVINQPENNDALARVANVPPRRIGDATMRALLDEADKSGITLWKLVIECIQGVRNTKSKLAKATEQGLSSFVNLILGARKKISDGTGFQPSIAGLIDFVIKKTSFQAFLERSHPEDHESRWANVQELINQAAEFSDSASSGEEDDEVLPKVDEMMQDQSTNPLSMYLANIALASASDIKQNDDETPPQAQVTISTIHAAKGLEWPVVFIPATYEGSIPHSRSEDTDEERRLLYVAMTRAQALLYMSYPLKNSQKEQTTLSQFLKHKSLAPHLSNKGPSFTISIVRSISNILKRTAPKCLDEPALSTLESLEDDIWPITGEDIRDDVNREMWNNNRYAQSHRLKRARTDYDGQHGKTEPWRPTYMITPMQPTTCSIIQKGGFSSAGSHLRELRERSVDSLAVVPSLISQSHRKGLGHEEGTAVRNSNKRVLEQASKHMEGQGNLTSFFRPIAQPKAQVLTESKNATEGTMPARLQHLKKAADKHLSCSGSPYFDVNPVDSGIPTALSLHHLGSASLCLPSSKNLEDGPRKNNPYIFLSSSPPRPDCPNRQAPDVPQLDEPPEGVNSKSKDGVPRTRPAETMHATSFSIVNAANVPRKTLGIRRSLDGWSNRGGPGFRPPAISKLS